MALREQHCHTQAHSFQTPNTTTHFPQLSTLLFSDKLSHNPYVFFFCQHSCTNTTLMASEMECESPQCIQAQQGFACLLPYSSGNTQNSPVEGTVTPHMNSNLSQQTHTCLPISGQYIQIKTCKSILQCYYVTFNERQCKKKKNLQFLFLLLLSL